MSTNDANPSTAADAPERAPLSSTAPTADITQDEPGTPSPPGERRSFLQRWRQHDLAPADGSTPYAEFLATRLALYFFAAMAAMYVAVIALSQFRTDGGQWYYYPVFDGLWYLALPFGFGVLFTLVNWSRMRRPRSGPLPLLVNVVGGAFITYALLVISLQDIDYLSRGVPYCYPRPCRHQNLALKILIAVLLGLGVLSGLIQFFLLYVRCVQTYKYLESNGGRLPAGRLSFEVAINFTRPPEDSQRREGDGRREGNGEQMPLVDV